MKKLSILIIIRQAPYANSLPAAALDLLLTASAFELELCLVFSGAGVLHLLDGQANADNCMKNISRALPSLDLYDIKRILCDESALQEKSIQADELLMPLQRVTKKDMAQEINKADLVFNF